MNTAQVVETSVTVNIQEVRSPGQSYSAYLWNDSWVQTFHKIEQYVDNRRILQSGRLLNMYCYIDTDEIPGFFLLLINHIFITRSEDTIFIFHVWGYWCCHGY